MPGYKFEYLDHTADVQIHSWGENLEEAFEGAALGMFNYMIPLSTVDVDPKFTNMDVFVEGHDLHSLLFHVSADDGVHAERGPTGRRAGRRGADCLRVQRPTQPSSPAPLRSSWTSSSSSSAPSK